MADLLIDISEMTGQYLRQKLIELTDATDAEWNERNSYVFSTNGKELFKLKPNHNPHQPRNGMISFKSGSKWSASRYDINQLLEVNDFAEKYNNYLRNKFEVTEPDPDDRAFQYFVLFQFEIARRVEEDRSDLPRRQAVEDAISRAVQLDTDEVYETLIKMFKDKRRQWCYLARRRHCDQLLSMTDAEVVAGEMEDLHL